MASFLGVDGGGTKTEFLCMDDAGSVLARALTGTSYYPQIGIEEAERRIRQGIGSIRKQLGARFNDIAFAFFGLPGYGENGTIDPQLHAACGRVLDHDRYACGNDMICGWAGSLACEDGINVVAGTGSIAYGERQGRSARVGGWSELFGDEGSAYWIAVKGLAAFSRMSDGRLRKGPLHSRFVATLSLSSDLEICKRIEEIAGTGRDRIAALAEVVSIAAEDDDAVAAEILSEAGGELAALAISLRDALGFPPDIDVPLSWSGGVLRNQRHVHAAFLQTAAAAGQFAAVEPRYDPAHGAALYAKRLARDRGSSGAPPRQ